MVLLQIGGMNAYNKKHMSTSRSKMQLLKNSYTSEIFLLKLILTFFFTIFILFLEHKHLCCVAQATLYIDFPNIETICLLESFFKKNKHTIPTPPPRCGH